MCEPKMKIFFLTMVFAFVSAGEPVHDAYRRCSVSTIVNGVPEKPTDWVCECTLSSDTCNRIYPTTLAEGKESKACRNRIGCHDLKKFKICCAFYTREGHVVQDLLDKCQVTVIKSGVIQEPAEKKCACVAKKSSCPTDKPKTLHPYKERYDCESRLHCNSDQEPCCYLGGGLHAPGVCILMSTEADGKHPFLWSTRCICSYMNQGCQRDFPTVPYLGFWRDVCNHRLACADYRPCCNYGNRKSYAAVCNITLAKMDGSKSKDSFRCYCGHPDENCPPPSASIFRGKETTECGLEIGCKNTDRVCCEIGSNHQIRKTTCSMAPVSTKKYKDYECTCAAIGKCPNDTTVIDRETGYDAISCNDGIGCNAQTQVACCRFGNDKLLQTSCKLTLKNDTVTETKYRYCECVPSSKKCVLDILQTLQVGEERTECESGLACDTSKEEPCCYFRRARHVIIGCEITTLEGPDQITLLRSCECLPESSCSKRGIRYVPLYRGEEYDTCFDKLNCNKYKTVPCCSVGSGKHIEIAG